MASDLKMPNLLADASAAAIADAGSSPTPNRMQSVPTGDAASRYGRAAPKRAQSEPAATHRVPLIGRLPIVKQFQVIGVVLAGSLALAALMVFLDARQASQAAIVSATATEMQ